APHPATRWVIQLLNGAARELRLPKDAGSLERVGWSSDGSALLVKTSKDFYRVEAPPAKPNSRRVPPEERAAAESSLAVLLGDPVFARVVPCSQAEDLCVIPRN